MKCLKKEYINELNQEENAKSERVIMQTIDNPFIVKLQFDFETNDKVYFVVDLMTGGELFNHLKKEKSFSEERTCFYAAEILLALECLHNNNIIHWDLKPENVLLDEEGHIKLMDFGTSKIMKT